MWPLYALGLLFGQSAFNSERHRLQHNDVTYHCLKRVDRQQKFRIDGRRLLVAAMFCCSDSFTRSDWSLGLLRNRNGVAVVPIVGIDP